MHHPFTERSVLSDIITKRTDDCYVHLYPVLYFGISTNDNIVLQLLIVEIRCIFWKRRYRVSQLLHHPVFFRTERDIKPKFIKKLLGTIGTLMSSEQLFTFQYHVLIEPPYSFFNGVGVPHFPPIQFSDCSFIIYRKQRRL